jgi:NTP pyrophosphatase (non-canonical NTP hydrolase)
VDRVQHLLLKLSEECDEVGQRAAKQIQFGAHEMQKGQSLTNAERLRLEVNDLLTVVRMLEEAGALPINAEGVLEAHIEYKKDKIIRYLELSLNLGMVA